MGHTRALQVVVPALLVSILGGASCQTRGSAAYSTADNEHQPQRAQSALCGLAVSQLPALDSAGFGPIRLESRFAGLSARCPEFHDTVDGDPAVRAITATVLGANIVLTSSDPAHGELVLMAITVIGPGAKLRDGRGYGSSIASLVKAYGDPSYQLCAGDAAVPAIIEFPRRGLQFIVSRCPLAYRIGSPSAGSDTLRVIGAAVYVENP